MKTSFHSLFPISRALPTVVFLTFAGQAALLAQTSGTWTSATSGNWSDSLNWSGNIVASGAGATADFSTLDLTGDYLVTVDTPFTIGTLLAQDATTASHNWTLAGTGPLTLDNGASKPVLNVINQSLAISTPLGGTNGFSKTGSGTLDLSGTCTYGGTTTLAAGTLKTSGGDNRLPTGTTLAFTGTTGTLDLTTTTQTLAGITAPDLLAASYTISGSSLTLNGTAVRQFGPGGAVTSAHSVATNFSGLSSFTSTAPLSAFRVGLKTGSSNATGGGSPGQAATVVLADQNAITASVLAIGDVAASNHGGTSTLRLGRVNTLNVGSINSGASGRSNSNLLFDPARINPSVTIRNTDGTSAVTEWRVGQVAHFAASTWTDSVDLSAGTVDALVTTVTVGTADITSTGRGGTENASFTMGAGTLEATTLLLGRISGANTTTITSTMAANGAFTLNHPSGVLKAATLTLAENTTVAGGTGARSVSGIFNLTSGTLEASTIQRGAQTGNATVTTAVNWTDGTIRNLTPSGLAINTLPLNLLTGSHVFDATGSATITLNATSTVSGIGGLTKTGTGTLSLQGTNTYTGPTDVQAGTLAISNSFPNGSAITIDAAATLELANVTLSGLPALSIAGNLNLTGPVKIGGPLSTIPGTLTGVLQYGSITGATNLGHDYRSASFTVGATSADLAVAAGLPLTWTGAGGNSWDVNTTVSWKDASNNPETFFWADGVTFDSAGIAAPNVNLTAEMQPAAVTVNENAVDYIFSGPGFISGQTGLTKDGLAKLTIETTNTNTGTTTINAGTVEIGSGGTTGWMGGGAIVNNGTLVFNRSNNATAANQISGTGSVTKLGAGTMTVTGNNSYAGGTNLQAGTLGFGSGALGTTGNITFTTGNSTLRWETGNTEDISSRLVMTDGVTSIFNTNGNNVTLASGFGGSSTGSLTKTGAGILELSGTNTYSGLTTITNGGGTLRITNKDAIGTGNVKIATAGTNTGTLELALTGTNSISNPFDGFSSANNLGSGNAQILNTSGDNTITSALTIASTGGNGLNVASNGGFLTLSGTITHTIASARTLNLGGSGDGLVSGNILNNAGPVLPVTLALTKTGGGTWTLTGTNDYTGNTNVNGGTLALGADNVLPDNSNVLIGAGTLNAATFDDAVGTLDCSAAGTINLGTGASLAFLDSSAVNWTGGALQITGTFVPGNGVDPGVGTNPGSLRFGTTNGGLTVDQLAGISAVGWTGFALDDYGYLTATVLVGYSSWASVNGAGANLNDDHDNDGVDNGVEYFMGGPNGNTTGFTALPGVTNTGGILSVTWTKAGDYTGTYGNQFVVETSDSLGGIWTDEVSPGNVTVSGNIVTYTFPSPLGTKRFARLRVTGP